MFTTELRPSGRMNARRLIFVGQIAIVRMEHSVCCIDFCLMVSARPERLEPKGAPMAVELQFCEEAATERT